jgi:hypothetical protein
MHALIRRLRTVAATLAVCSSAAGQTTTLISEASNSAVWYSSSGNQTILNTFTLASDGKLSVGSGQHALTYFTASGTQRSIANGESLQATFTLNFGSINNSSTAFRVGLFDSQVASRPSSSGSWNFQAYDGYLFSFNPSGGSSNSLRLRQRTPNGATSPNGVFAPASTGLLNSFSEETAPVKDPKEYVSWTYDVASTSRTSGFTAPSPKTLTQGTNYQASYSVSGEASGALTFAFSISSGSTIVFQDSLKVTSPTTSSFDAFALYYVGGSFSVDNLLINYTAAAPSSSSSGVSAFDLGGATVIPEPSTYAACAGAAVLGLAFWRRRLAAAKAAVA